MKTIVHVNQHKIRSNLKNPENREPVLTAKTYKDNQYGNRVEILDTQGEVIGTFVYNPDKPLSCGARVWFETTNDVNVKQ